MQESEQKSGILRLLQFNEAMSKPPTTPLFHHWQHFTREHFSDAAILRLTLVHSENASNYRIFGMLRYGGLSHLSEISNALIPRFFTVLNECELHEMHLFMSNPREFMLPSGQILVFCVRAFFIHSFTNGTQVCYLHAPLNA